MPPPSPESIINIANAFYKSQTLFAASDYDIFSFLSQNPAASCEKIAENCGLSERGCRLLLDGCVAIGLLSKDENDNYSNTAQSGFFLVDGSPADLRKAIRYNRDVYAAWGKLPEFAKTGKPVEKPEVHLGDDSDRTRTFALSMHGRAMGIGRAVVPHLRLEACRNLLDVGGGPGTYASLIAQTNPGIKCISIDLPEISKIASEIVEQMGVADRVQTLPGNYRECEFPTGMDAVIFFGVLHQESPESIVSLFKKAAASLNPGGSVYVLDMMTDQTHTAPEFSALFALNMALTTENGWVFSDKELEGWLAEAGLTNFRVSPLAPPMPHWLAQAEKA